MLVSTLLTPIVSAELLPGAHHVGDVGLERRVAADVLGDEFVVHIDDALVGGGVDAGRRPARRLQPRGTRTVAGTRPSRRGRGSTGRRTGRCSWRARAPRACVQRWPARARPGGRFEGEPPQAVQADQLAGGGGRGFSMVLLLASDVLLASDRALLQSIKSRFDNFGNRLPELGQLRRRCDVCASRATAATTRRPPRGPHRAGEQRDAAGVPRAGGLGDRRARASISSCPSAMSAIHAPIAVGRSAGGPPPARLARPGRCARAAS